MVFALDTNIVMIAPLSQTIPRILRTLMVLQLWIGQGNKHIPMSILVSGLLISKL